MGRNSTAGWRRSSYCAGGECAEVSGMDSGLVAVRSSLRPGEVVTLSGPAFAGLLRAIRDGEFDDLAGPAGIRPGKPVRPGTLPSLAAVALLALQVPATALAVRGHPWLAGPCICLALLTGLIGYLEARRRDQGRRG